MTLMLIRPAPSTCTPLRNAVSRPPRAERSNRSASVTRVALPSSSAGAVLDRSSLDGDGLTEPAMLRKTRFGACSRFASRIATMGNRRGNALKDALAVAQQARHRHSHQVRRMHACSRSQRRTASRDESLRKAYN